VENGFLCPSPPLKGTLKYNSNSEKRIKTQISNGSFKNTANISKSLKKQSSEKHILN